tara:strand:- start:1028 stop:1237 length:210 start_codon:yes stop_codon:yes gene_type:complete
MTHAATREDIANLRKEVKDDISRLDAKIDTVNTSLINKMDSNFKCLVGIIITGIIFSPVSLALVTHFIK